MKSKDPTYSEARTMGSAEKMMIWSTFSVVKYRINFLLDVDCRPYQHTQHTFRMELAIESSSQLFYL